MCSGPVNGTWPLSYKVRCLLSLLRTHPRPGLCRYSALSPAHLSRFAKKASWRNLSCRDEGSASQDRLRDWNGKVVRLYSSSDRDAFKAQAPVGIYEEDQKAVEWNSPGGRLSQSFHRLSGHINTYFKRKGVPAPSEKATPEYIGRPQRRFQSQRGAREKNEPEVIGHPQGHKFRDPQGVSVTTPSAQEVSGVQLFHTSTLATRFGESYSYVANHINSVFSQGSAKKQKAQKACSAAEEQPSREKQKLSNAPLLNSEEAEKSRVQSGVARQSAEANELASGGEEGYLHFARHINRYFGARVGGGGQSRREQLPAGTQSAPQTRSCATSPPQREVAVAPETRGLFHGSRNTTNFGENYFQMARHINRYFEGPSGAEADRNAETTDPGSAARSKRPTLMDCFRHPTSAIPDMLGAYLNQGPGEPQPAGTSPQARFNQKLVLSRRQAEEITRGLIDSLGLASSPGALVACVEALNEHLIRHPSSKALMWQEKTAVTLLRKRRSHGHDQLLQGALRETLALIGYVDPVKGCGIRVLSIDGGGTRGVVPLQVLKLLEEETGRKIHQLFDYICGVSTGAVLAFMLGLARISLEDCADMYRRFGSEVFRQNPLVGTVKMGWSHSYYSTETWETILREKLGKRVLIKTAGDELSPKVSAVSAVVNWGTSPKAFVFRNYNHRPGSLSRYAGGSGYQMWEAVRASSAAPGYFQEFPLQSDIHQDGGILLNNPCALAVHESRLLWPNQPFQCVLSLGTGRYDNAKRGPVTSTSLRAKISNLICSATDTEGVHTLLDDLLAPDVYFRFNPMLSALVSLDESRPGALRQLHADTQTYLERNRLKLARLCLVLGAQRSPVSRTKDWMSERAWEMKQRWG